MTKDIDQATGLGKVCTKCGEWKLLSEYYARRESSDGYRNDCKECRKSQTRTFRAENLEHVKLVEKKTRLKNVEAKKSSDQIYRSKNKDKIRERGIIWKAENPEKVKANSARYREKHKDVIREKQRKYNDEHRDEQLEWHRLDRLANPEKSRAKSKRERERNREAINTRNLEGMKRKYAENPEYREKKKADAREYGKTWRQENKEVARVHTMARRARVRGAEGAHTADDIRRINEAQGFKCTYCGTSTLTDFHVDHMTPLSRGGSNWPDNLQILCAVCNVSKWSRTHEEYLLWKSAVITLPQISVVSKVHHPS